jgi:hypothetical protein
MIAQAVYPSPRLSSYHEGGATTPPVVAVPLGGVATDVINARLCPLKCRRSRPLDLQRRG